MQRPLGSSLSAQLDAWLVAPPRVVVVAPVGRSGSIFLQSLFDGHPAVVTFPAWFPTELDEGLPWPALTAPEVRARMRTFVTRNIGVFDGRRSFFGDTWLLSRGGQLGERADEFHSVPEGPFIDAIAEMLAGRTVDARCFFLALHLALCHATAQPTQPLSTILTHNHLQLPRTYELIRRGFPDARYIFTTRDPRESLVSFAQIEAELAGQPHVFSECVAHLRIHADQALRADRVARAVEAARVRYADLNRMHADGPRLMRAISEWVGLPWRDSLLRSTVQGLKWPGNAIDRVPTTGFDPTRARYRWTERQLPRVSRLIEHLFFHYLRAMRYQAPSVRPSRSSALLTLWTHAPVPALFPVATFETSPGRLLDAALTDPVESFSSPIARLVPLPLARAERAARNLYRFHRDENRRRLELFKLRYRREGLAIFGELDAAFETPHVRMDQLLGAAPTPG